MAAGRIACTRIGGPLLFEPIRAALLSLPSGERYPTLGLTPQKQKEKTLRALVAQVEGLAARQPVLMLFEDAQWSDPTSLELLELMRASPAASACPRRSLRRSSTAPTGCPCLSRS